MTTREFLNKVRETFFPNINLSDKELFEKIATVLNTKPLISLYDDKGKMFIPYLYLSVFAVEGDTVQMGCFVYDKDGGKIIDSMVFEKSISNMMARLSDCFT